MFIVECTGFPGSGKSTVIREIKKILCDKGVSLLTDEIEIFAELRKDSHAGRLQQGRIRKICHFLSFLTELIVRQPQLFSSVVYCLYRFFINRRSLDTWESRFKLLQDLMFETYMTSRLQGQQGSYSLLVRSEGVIHGGGCLAVQACDRDTISIFETFLRRTPLPDVLLHIVVTKEVAMHRMLDRGIPDDWPQDDRASVGPVYNRWERIFSSLGPFIQTSGMHYIKIDNTTEQSRLEGVTKACAAFIRLEKEAAQ